MTKTNTTTNTSTETYHPQRRLGVQAKKQDLVEATRTDNTKTVKAKANAKEGAARSNRLYLEHTDGGRGRDNFNIFELVSQCGKPTALERASRMPKAHQKAVHGYLAAAYTAELSELDQQAQQAQPGNGYSGNSAATFKQDQLRRDLSDAIQRHQQQAETFDEALRKMYTGDELNKRLSWADYWIEFAMRARADRAAFNIRYAAKTAAEDAAKAKARAEAKAKARAEAEAKARAQPATATAQSAQPAQCDRQRHLGNIKKRMENMFGSNEFFNCAKGVVFLDVTPDMDKLTAWTRKP